MAAHVSAAAHDLTGARLVQLCGDRNSAEWEQRGQWICASYVRGVMDGIRVQAMSVAGSVETYERLVPICLPPGGTADEAIRIVVRHLEAKPELRSRGAGVVVFEALRAEWPCAR